MDSDKSEPWELPSVEELFLLLVATGSMLAITRFFGCDFAFLSLDHGLLKNVVSADFPPGPVATDYWDLFEKGYLRHK